MSKHIVIYQENSQGQIEKIETINGEVVNEGHEAGWNPFAWFSSLFSKANPERDTDNEHAIDVEALETCNIKGHEDYQYQCNSDVAEDYQGTVPGWDGLG